MTRAGCVVGVLGLLVVTCSGTPQTTRTASGTAVQAAVSASPARTTAYPAARFDYAMAFDVASGAAIMFGGFLQQDPSPVWTDETWAYNVAAKAWRRMRPAVAPSPRHYPAMAYDAASDRVILFGGGLPQGRLSGETWTYDVDTDTWTEMRPATSPSPRSAWAAMIYDPARDRVVLHGGWTGKENASDTWAYDLKVNAWTKLGDGPRSGRPLVYDGVGGRILAFGGSPDPPTRTAEMWAFTLDADTWSRLSPQNAPTARSSPMQYAPASGRIVLFGGSVTRGQLGETWTYDPANNAWTQRRSDPAPKARHGHALVYDPVSKTLLLFGGGVGSTPLDDTWIYDPDRDRWTMLD